MLDGPHTARVPRLHELLQQQKPIVDRAHSRILCYPGLSNLGEASEGEASALLVGAVQQE